MNELHFKRQFMSQLVRESDPGKINMFAERSKGEWMVLLLVLSGEINGLKQ